MSRSPSGRETELLQKVYEQALAKYQANPAAARTVLQNAAATKAIDGVQAAAWFHVATVLLNLDEAITK
jgi:hypothetical protein